MQHRASDNPDTGLDPEVAGRVPGASGGRRWEVADFRELPGKVREFPDRVQPGSSRPRSSRSRTGPYNSWTQSGTRELPNLVLAASGCPKLNSPAGWPQLVGKYVPGVACDCYKGPSAAKKTVLELNLLSHSEVLYILGGRTI